MLRRMKQQVKGRISETERYKIKFKAVLISRETIYGSVWNLFSTDKKEDVDTIAFDDCIMNSFPSSTTLKCVTNLQGLFLYNCKISRISCKDLVGLENLRVLDLSFNNIEHLTKGLFNSTPNLEMIDFEANNIIWIHHDILEPLQKLKFFDLTANSEFDMIFDEAGTFGSSSSNKVSLAELKEEIKNKYEVIEKEDIKNTFKATEKNIGEIKELQETCANQAKEIADQAKEIAALKELIERSIPNDFTIKINGKNKKVNKGILASASPMLAKLINENPEADHLELSEISEDTFKAILNYMKKQTPPNQETNFIELYAASCRLEMKELMEITADMLMERVNMDNALDVLNLCHKYKNEDLRQRAFDELKKSFPNN